jgi:uncharacterized protein (TIGR03086 family)
VRELHHDALERFSRAIDGTPPDAWERATPCAEWDVRALVNHVVGENVWVVPMLAGSTVAEVGSQFDGDLLGDDPKEAWHASVGPAIDAVERTPLDQIVHLSFGDFPAEEYLWQLTTDVLVHSWDLARATGQSEDLPPHVVEACGGWFDNMEDAYRGAGVIGPRVSVASGDPTAVFLGRFGREA